MTDTASTADLLDRPFREAFGEVETRARAIWEAEKPDRCDLDSDNPDKRYVLGMFPYPSGNAHLGHVRVYALSDAVARLSRFRGYEVLHPLGWDAFGLPAENAAIKNKVDPAEWTAKNIHAMKHEQFSRLGISFDLAQETNSSSPEFYRWTQWLFQTLYDHGLVYRADGWVNWDPVDETVLANEQVIDGLGWRSGAPVERRRLQQWYIRITEYAQQLWDGLDTLQGGWSDEAIAVQRGWIGRSEGVEIAFPVVGSDEHSIRCYTTRADTIFGVTSVTLAPEHELVKVLASPEQRPKVDEYVAWATNRSELERETAERTGVELGASCRNPLTGEAADAEGLAALGHGAYAVSFEREHRIDRYDISPDWSGVAIATPTPMPAPPGTDRLRENGGMEALVPSEFGLWAGVEYPIVEGQPHSIWHLRDGAEDYAINFRTPAGFGITGMARHGGIFVLERFYSRDIGNRIRISMMDDAVAATGAGQSSPLLAETLLAELEPGMTIDNFEGISVGEVEGETRLFILSDDNYNPGQRTLLLSFAIVE